MNKVIITGRLCQEVELKQSTGGKSVITNSVAVKRDYKNAQGEYDSDFINIVVWGQQADYLSKYAHKGDRVEIVGRWTVRKYQANDGTNRIVNECTVETITALGRQQKQENNTYIPDAYTQMDEIPSEDQLPF